MQTNVEDRSEMVENKNCVCVCSNLNINCLGSLLLATTVDTDQFSDTPMHGHHIQTN